jgi:hypothetical protein
MEMRRISVAFGLLTAIGCQDTQVEPENAGKNPSISASISSDKADAVERVSSPRRAAMLRDAGFDPIRFADYVNEIPLSRRGDFFLLLETVPGVVIQAAKGSREEGLLHAARLTRIEQEVWEKEKSRNK